MKVIWRSRPHSNRKPRYTPAAPQQYHCPHTPSPHHRLYMPALASRREGVDCDQPPLLFQLPRIVTCCLASEELRGQWWADIEAILVDLTQSPPNHPSPLPPPSWLDRVYAQLAEVVPRPLTMEASAGKHD